jgi:hypothetical protein
MITEKDFKAYTKVQHSGVTNMFMISTVMKLSRLTREQCLDIMGNYLVYREKFESEDK